MSLTTTRTIERLRYQGYLAQTVEMYNPWSRKRRDLFGFIDIVAVRPGEVLGVQATTFKNRLARIKKSLDLTSLKTWLLSGADYQVWGWKKDKGVWVPIINSITIADWHLHNAKKGESDVKTNIYEEDS